MVVPEITSETEEGFADLTFAIQNAEFSPAGDCTLTALGQHKGTKVGLIIVVRAGMKPGFVNGQVQRDAFAADGIVFRRLAEESDSLVACVADLYGVPAKPARMREEVRFTAWPLGGDPKQIRTEEVKFKAFFGDGANEKEYAELFVNIDVAKRKAEIREKDPDYRANVVKALAGP